MKYIATAAILAVAAGMASATCPNLCNGHGTCETSDRCVCFGNWQGADCSERVCNYGLAWVDAPSATDTAHWYAECSNKGVCDRETGLCECYEGYTGKGCRRSTCPNDCSGHGTCYYIEELSALDSKVKVDYDNMQSYTTWDKSKIQACVCDPYYEGTDCSLRQCPRGDNILTLNDVATEQTIAFTSAAGALSGEFTVTFTDLYGGVWETTKIPVAGGNDLRDALQALPNKVVEAVTVVSTQSGENWAHVVTFSSDHNAGVQNDMKINTAGCSRAGCTPIYTGINEVSQGQWTVLVTDTTAANSHKEAKVCSEHGVCDSETGLCECFSGYYDEDCSKQTVLV